MTVAGNSEVALTWQAPASDGGAAISSYEYRYAAGASVPADTGWTSGGTALSVPVNGLDNGTPYAFEVRAVNAAGNGPTAAVAATPATVPDAPQNLAAAAGNGMAVLTWQAPAGDGGSAIFRYQYRYAAGDSVPADTGWNSVGTALTVTVNGLDIGTQYAFEVRAVSAIGNGPTTAAAATPAPVPDAPQNLTAAAGDANVTLTWEAAARNLSPSMLRYEYRYAAGDSVPADMGWTSVGTARTARVNSLDNGTQYAFEVRAVNGVGNGPATVAKATPVSVPDAPQNLALTIGNGEVALTWQAPASDGGAAISSYEYRYAAGASIPPAKGWTSVGTALTAKVGGLINGTPYAFEVRAVNGVGNSPAVGTTATPATVPVSPQNLAAVAGEGKAILTWQAPTSDGGSAILRYQYRYAAGATVPAGTDWTSAGTALTVTVSGLDNGTQYAFEVRAVSVAGNGAAAAVKATPATVPDTPQNLAAVAGNAEVALTWQASAGNGGPAIIRYEYRYAAGASVPAGKGWTSAETALTATVNGLDNGTQYAFEVRAVNAIGNGAAAAAAATPATVPNAPQNLTAAIGDGKAILTWQAPASEGGSAILRYQYRFAAGASVPAGTGWMSVGTALTATVSGLDNGTSYAFEVRAVNGVGNGAAATAKATLATLPEAPQNLEASAGDGQVTLKWEAPSSDGGAPILRYQHRYAAGATVPAGTDWTSAGTALTATVKDLVNGTQYTFEVRAVNIRGGGAAARTAATPVARPTVAELQRHIAGFMLNRANTLVGNQPGLTRFLKPGGNKPGGNSLKGQGAANGGAVRGSVEYRDVWLNIKGAWSSTDGAASRSLFGALGTHWQLNERLLAGIVLQFDTADETLAGRNGSIAGKGWLVGPYFAGKLAEQPLFFEGRLLYGQSTNRLDHAKGVSGEFETSRWLAQLRVEGEVGLESGLTLNPFADLAWTQDRQHGFTDSLGRRVGGQKVSLGQAKIGIDFRLPLELEQDELVLSGGAEGIFSTSEGGATGTGFEGGRARLGLGLLYRPDDGIDLKLKGYYDGIGARDYKGHGIGGSLSIRF